MKSSSIILVLVLLGNVGLLFISNVEYSEMNNFSWKLSFFFGAIISLIQIWAMKKEQSNKLKLSNIVLFPVLMTVLFFHPIFTFGMHFTNRYIPFGQEETSGLLLNTPDTIPVSFQLEIMLSEEDTIFIVCESPNFLKEFVTDDKIVYPIYEGFLGYHYIVTP